MYLIFSVRSSAGGYLRYFRVLAVVNSAAVNIAVHAPFQILFSLDLCLGVGLLCRMIALILAF